MYKKSLASLWLGCPKVRCSVWQGVNPLKPHPSANCGMPDRGESTGDSHPLSCTITFSSPWGCSSLMGTTGILLLTVGIGAMLWVSPDRGASAPRPAVPCLREEWGPCHKGLTGHFVHRMGLILHYTNVGLLKWNAATCWTVKPSAVLWFPQWHYHWGKIFATFILPEQILYLQLDVGS